MAGVATLAFVLRALVRRLAPEAAGSGIQQVKNALRGQSRPISARVIPVKFIGGTLAIGSGFVIGREAPTIQMGAVLGHLCGRALRLAPEDRLVLLAAGSGAGLAAAFNAPLAGAIFVFEELLRRFDERTVVPTLAACGAALAVMRTITGDHTVLKVPPMDPALTSRPLLFLGFGAILGLVGSGYLQLMLGALRLADRCRGFQLEVMAAVVGAIVGLLGFFAPLSVGGGEPLIQALLDNRYGLPTVAWILAARSFLGPLSYAPGLPGGFLAPLLLIGAAAGALLGGLTRLWLPQLDIPVAAFIAVGMASCFVAVVRAPVTGIALAIEMTGAPTLFVPILVACASATAVPATLGLRPIYDSLQAQR